MMYAIHPGSLPPTDPRGKERIQVTAADLAKLYHLEKWEYIVWDPTDNYEWYDFIHLYPSYYGRYTRKPDRTPELDVPCDYNSSGTWMAGHLSVSRVVTSTPAKKGGSRNSLK